MRLLICTFRKKVGEIDSKFSFLLAVHTEFEDRKWKYKVQQALVICGLFICDFAYMWLKLWHFRGTYPPKYQSYWSHYMQIHYMQANFLGPYLSHITGVARLFWSKAKFENYFSSRAALLEISDDKVTISAKQKNLVLFMLLLIVFDQISDSRRSLCCFF